MDSGFGIRDTDLFMGFWTRDSGFQLFLVSGFGTCEAMFPSYAEDRISRSEDEHQCPRHVAHRYTWLLRVVREFTIVTKWVVASIAAAADLVGTTIDAIALVVGSSSHRCYRSISRCRLAA